MPRHLRAPAARAFTKAPALLHGLFPVTFWLHRQGQRISGLRTTDGLTAVLFWVLVLGYIVLFCALSLRRYDAFVPHALDLGNMEQAIWNTLHGRPFHFTNMRRHDLGIEAFGTDSRLSFHVEPILVPLALLHLVYGGPQALLVAQTVILSSGALAVRRLVHRHLPGSQSASLAFPIAYLLFPALQAANLYEFHPVTLTAALLLWAFDFADAQAYGRFCIPAVAAVACKEDIGIAVAALAAWMLLRRRSRPARSSRVFWVLCGTVGLSWTLVAFLVIIPHWSPRGTPYTCRLLPPGSVLAGKPCPSLRGVLSLWGTHPQLLWALLTLSPKLGFLHRLFVSTGYLALFNPLSLLPMVPGLVLILVSGEPHMYSGLAHYSAELVPALVVSAILGTEWLAYHLAPAVRLRPAVVVPVLSAYLVTMSITNTQANGFGPGSAGFFFPPVTAHERLGHRLLALIPPSASVAAQDQLDPHLSDRADVYLFPDWNHLPGVFGRQADYIFLDVTTDTFPITPAKLVQDVNYLLRDPAHPYGIVAAEDGYLLLKKGRRGAHVLLPTSPFFSFMEPRAPTIQHPLIIDYGPTVQMLGYDLVRREQVNLRASDVVLTTYWRVTRPLTERLSLGFFLSNADGAITYQADLNQKATDQMALDWLPTSRWQPGQIIRITTEPMTIATVTPGTIDVDMIVVHQGGDVATPRWRLSPLVRQAPTPLETVEDNTMVKLTTIAVPF